MKKTKKPKAKLKLRKLKNKIPKAWAEYQDAVNRQMMEQRLKNLHITKLEKNIANGVIGKSEAEWISSLLPNIDYFSKSEMKKRAKIAQIKDADYLLFFGIKVGLMVAKAKI